MSAVTIQQMADRVAQLLEEKLALRGKDLEARLQRGGRLLPRRVREGAELLAEASEKAKNPKLLGQIDMGQVSDAYDACVRHLITIDPSGRRRDTVGSMIGSVGFGVLVMVILVVGLLFWQGYF
jgi:hypothetical protein